MVIIFICSIMFVRPATAETVSPQPTEKQKGVKLNPGDTKSGIAIEEKQSGPTKPKSATSTGSIKAGIVVEDKKTIGAFAPQPEPPKQERINELVK
jgi:predicted PhzF superfamily epimerase YddE/YHI9